MNSRSQHKRNDSPGVQRKSSQFWILKVDLARDVIQSCLGSAIRGVMEIALLHVRHAGRRSTQRDEFGRLGIVEER